MVKKRTLLRLANATRAMLKAEKLFKEGGQQRFYQEEKKQRARVNQLLIEVDIQSF